MASFFLYPLSGKDAVEKFLTVLAQAFSGSIVEEFRVDTSLMDQHVHFSQVAAQEVSKNPAVVKLLEVLTGNPAITCNRILARIQHNNISFNYASTGDGISDTVALNHPSGAGALEFNLQWLNAVSKNFEISRKPVILASAFPEAQKDVMRFYERTVADLGAQVAKLGDYAARQIMENDRILNKKIAEQDEKFANKVATQDAQHQSKLTAIEEDWKLRNGELTRREQELQAKLQKFDLTERKAARRKLQGDLTKLIDEQTTVNVKPEVGNKRVIIHIVCWLTLAGLGWLLAYVIYHLVSQTEFHWHHAWPIGLVGFGFGITLYFYLKFNLSWFNELARAEFSNRKLKADILRANWVSELFLESKENAQIEVPKELLISFSKNLFHDFAWDEKVKHPIDDALDLARGLKKVKIDRGGVEFQQKPR